MAALRLPRLPRNEAIVDQVGKPLLVLQRWWQSVVEKIEAQESAQDDVIAELVLTQAALIATQDDLEATQADLAATQAELASAQTELATAVDNIVILQSDVALGVIKDQTPAWSTPGGTLTRSGFTSYGGQTIAGIYDAGQVQAIDDHVQVLSARLAALITDLRGNDALT